ncbi:MAG: hypothetical protein LBP88_05030 [Treponema sp.]|nr:hypothetical protein [Treponema sp.]
MNTYCEGTDFDPLVKTSSTFDGDHGRQERRNHGIPDDGSWLVATHPHGKTIKSIGTRGETVTTEQR